MCARAACRGREGVQIVSRGSGDWQVRVVRITGYDSAVGGSIIALTSEMRMAGKSPLWACASISFLLGAI
jgi:hypothetical protein